jgi:hypothetical protein
MGEIRYVIITNHCDETITVHLRYPRPKKESNKKTKHPPIILRPTQKSVPLPYNSLIGAKGWNLLSTRECIVIANILFEPRFIRVKNLTSTPVDIEIESPVKGAKFEKRQILVDPNKSSHIVDSHSITQPKLLDELIKQGTVSIKKIAYIGPAVDKEGVVGSYFGEEVYICYECGRPIVFRGNPPRPIHI